MTMGCLSNLKFFLMFNYNANEALFYLTEVNCPKSYEFKT